MPRIVHVDALVVEIGAIVRHRVGAIEHDIARFRLDLYRIKDRRELRPLPLADRAPAFDTIVARDLRTRFERAQFGERETSRRSGQSADLQLVIGKAFSCERHVRLAVRFGGSVTAKARREVRFRKFLRHRLASGDQRLRRFTKPLARCKHLRKPLAFRQAFTSG